MKATEAKLLDFLKRSPQFVIPIYQRTYSWTEAECRQLWADILRAGASETINSHFVGSIVYIEKGLSNLTVQEPMLVIDGQQRLTTLTLIIAALADAIEKLPDEQREPIPDFSPAKLRGYYLLNGLESGERRYKLLLTQTDKQTLIATVEGGLAPKENSLRITANSALFQSLLAECKGNYLDVCKGLAKLVVVDVALNRGQDNPQLIFESMNSTGKELSQADLIRNFVLMGLETGLQTRLYEQFWRPMEVDFGQEAYTSSFDSFMRHYLTVKTGAIPRIDQVYSAFKAHARASNIDQTGVEALIKDVREFAGYFCAMELRAEPDKDLSEAFQDLRELRVDVAYPFLLELYHDYRCGVLSKAEFLTTARLVESYVFRRAICAIPTNSLNKTFATFGKSLKKDRYAESIFANFLTLPSYRRFPSDEEFQKEIQKRDLYHFPRAKYWLRRLENHKRKESVSVGEYTIEHILPQGSPLPVQWQSALGDDWERIWSSRCHTLGNLTLTGYNSEYSNRPFPEKRDMEGGFKESPLHLNAGLGALELWNEAAIDARAERLAGQAVKVWSSPTLPADILEAYRAQPTPGKYTIADHPHLLTPPMKEVYESFRREVLSLDPCVSEEFLKLYVAFKAETNFVDVVPQAKRLKLSLNMKFIEVDDPLGICEDVSNLGRWGNGDVSVSLNSIDDIPYVMGLVRQSFERQIDVEASA